MSFLVPGLRCFKTARFRDSFRCRKVDGRRVERALDKFAREENGGLVALPDFTTTMHRDLIVALANKHRLPAAYPFSFFVRAGGMMSYGVDIIDQYRRA